MNGNNGCEYCTENRPVICRNTVSNHQIYVSDGNIYSCFNDDDIFSSIGRKIHYCPMCGRKFDAEQTDKQNGEGID
jgi:hypothetical protein